MATVWPSPTYLTVGLSSPQTSIARTPPDPTPQIATAGITADSSGYRDDQHDTTEDDDTDYDDYHTECKIRDQLEEFCSWNGGRKGKILTFISKLLSYIIVILIYELIMIINTTNYKTFINGYAAKAYLCALEIVINPYAGIINKVLV